MSETEPRAAGAARKAGLGRGLTTAIGAAVLIGVAYFLYVIFGSAIKPGEATGDGLHALATASMSKLQVPATPSGYPSVPFTDAAGRPLHLADFRGKVVVLNLWATWCAPCVKEMPTLARLQAAYPERVKVVALSQDRASETDAAKRFIAARPPLAFYQDAPTAMMMQLGPHLVAGFPTTLIFDRGGTLRATLAGEADWSSPEARAVIDRVLTL